MSLEDEIKNLKDTINSLKNQLNSVENKVSELESKISGGGGGITTTKKEEPLAAPIPTAEPPRTSVITSNTQMVGATATVEKKHVIKQALPRGGATSQIKAKKGVYRCPQCDSDYYEEVEDKNKVLYVVGPGLNVYGKKLRCWNCGHEWPKPA
ncbi:MAG: hypothetical protein EAX96_00055 [Candidatus Lokiarchaeota archaeon]|nr:hypothetical protein [Candidatus Lokiarchaeota archaeon]